MWKSHSEQQPGNKKWRNWSFKQWRQVPRTERAVVQDEKNHQKFFLKRPDFGCYLYPISPPKKTKRDEGIHNQKRWGGERLNEPLFAFVMRQRAAAIFQAFLCCGRSGSLKGSSTPSLPSVGWWRIQVIMLPCFHLPMLPPFFLPWFQPNVNQG